MPRQNIEAIIRDNLAGNLGFIEPGLVLIQEEYHLRNQHGANGFVDLFARDRSGNFVVIEIKRSDAAEREAITELAKYAALIRASKNIRPSELRLMVISTSWRELLVPFSELFHNTSYQLEGYRLQVDSRYTPTALEQVKPLPQVEGRKLCRRHFVRYYKTDEDMLAAERVLASESRRSGIKDFVIVRLSLNVNDPFYGATRALYYAQQLKDRGFYEALTLKTADAERAEEIQASIEDLDESDAVDELADWAIADFEVPSETGEIGHPEKFSQRTGEGIWQLLGISRYGIFEEDERLTDEHLVGDISGLTGASFTHYFAAFKLRNRAKLKEVKNEIDNSLFHNDVWRHAIEDILKYASRKGAESAVLHVFNKDDILETIWLSDAVSPDAYEPKFLVLVERDAGKKIEVFRGQLLWTPTDVDLSAVMNEIFDGGFRKYILLRHSGGQRSVDKEVMRRLGFSYSVNYMEQTGDEIDELKNVVIRGNSVQSHSGTDSLDFVDFLERKPSWVNELLAIFSKHHAGGGTFQF